MLLHLNLPNHLLYTEAYKRLENRLLKSGGYIAGDAPTLADFYALVWVVSPVESNLLPLDEHPVLLKWYQKMQEVKACAFYKNKWRKTFKKALFLVKYMVPLLKCMTCAC